MPVEYGASGFRRVIRYAVLYLRDLLALSVEKVDIFSAWLNVSYNHVTSPESRNVATWAVSSATMSSVIIDDTSQIGAPAIVCSTTNLHAGIA